MPLWRSLCARCAGAGVPVRSIPAASARTARLWQVIFRLAPLLDGDGRLTGYAAISHDITQRKAQEKLRQLLFEELNHRVKNTLAIVQSIARFTERQCESLEDFGPAFSGRIQALAAATAS